MLLLLPRKSWIVELKPMTRFLLAAAYSAPFARGDLAETFSGNVHFLPSERMLKNTLAPNQSDSDYFRKRIASKRSHIWSATTNQPLADRFIFNRAFESAQTSPAHLHAHSRFSSKRFGRPNASVLFWRTLGIQIALLEHRHWNKCDRFANSFTIDSTICRSE